jgi:Family of unknown function (DUF6173)
MDSPKDISGSLAERIASLDRLPVLDIPLPPPNPLVLAAESNLASAFHTRLVKWISDFDAGLDEAHEVGVRLVNFGQTVTFRLSGIGYWNPSLISFRGVTEDGNPVELIQHVTQISVLLMKLPRPDPSVPKHPIGFALDLEGESNVE